MAITFSEKGVSGSISGGGQNEYALSALAHCTAGETSMDVFVAACADSTDFPFTTSVVLPDGTPVTYLRETIHVVPKEEEGQAPTWFTVDIPYVMLGMSQQPYSTGDVSTQFSIGFQQINTKFSKATSIQYSLVNPGGTPPNFHGLINVTNDEVQGVDLDYPTYTWSETHYFDASVITPAYIAALYAVAANPVCNASFKNFAASEVKFLGVEGSERHKGGDWELTFKFAASPNFTSLTIDVFTGIVKKGWEYLWCYYEEIPDTAGSTPVRTIQVRDVVVNQVYGTSNFATLGIGT